MLGWSSSKPHQLSTKTAPSTYTAALLTQSPSPPPPLDPVPPKCPKLPRVGLDSSKPEARCITRALTPACHRTRSSIPQARSKGQRGSAPAAYTAQVVTAAAHYSLALQLGPAAVHPCSFLILQLGRKRLHFYTVDAQTAQTCISTSTSKGSASSHSVLGMKP